MNNILNYLLIGVALSMDAFSVSIGLETNKFLDKNKKILLISLIGILHFVMPYIGSLFNLFITINLSNIANYILALIFLILGIEILFSKDEYKDIINNLTIFIISITVSIDSLTIGLGLSLVEEYSILASIIFMIISSLFTIIGLFIGKLLNNKINNKTNLLGGILLFLLSLKYFFKI